MFKDIRFLNSLYDDEKSADYVIPYRAPEYPETLKLAINGCD